MATYQEQIERMRQQREAKVKAEEEAKARQLSPEQIKNWRQALAFTAIGGAAYVIPDQMVQAIYEKFMGEINSDAPLDTRKVQE